jgi:hypothetical protein
MRGTILTRAIALAAACAALTGLPVTSAQARETGCVWAETPIPPADKVGTPYVAGGTGSGDYAGSVQWVSPQGEFFLDMVLWTGDSFGRTQQPPAGYMRPSPVDENSSGTVVLSAQKLDQSGSQAFRYYGGHQGLGLYQELPTPKGFLTATPVAINDRGDVLGYAYRGDGPSAPVLWPGDGSPPTLIVLPPDYSFVQARDLDNDGTALLTVSTGPALWRAGQLIPLTAPDGYRLTSTTSIRGGKVVGYARGLDDVATYQGFLWTDPAHPQPIKGSAIGDDINTSGLVIGRDSDFSDAVWQNTTFVDAFPDTGSPTQVFDDGSILGERSGGGYAVWRGACF